MVEHTPAQLIAGIDHSEVMLAQASMRSVSAIQDGRVILELGSVSSLPYQDAYFDKVFTVNSFHFWSEPSTDLGEVRRIMKPNGLIIITIQPEAPLPEKVKHAELDELFTFVGKKKTKFMF